MPQCLEILNSSCKVISTTQGRFFLLVTWLDSTFDLQITNAKRCWRQTGIHAPPHHSFAPKVWLAHAKEALYDLEPSRQFEFQVEFLEPGGSVIQLEWTAIYEDGRSYVCVCQLSAAPDQVLESIMSDLCGSYNILRGSVVRLDAQNCELASQVDNAQQQLKDLIESNKTREADVFIKFTLVLNSKKEQLQLLTNRLAAAQADVARLTEQLALQGGDVASHATGDDRSSVSGGETSDSNAAEPHGATVDSLLPPGDDNACMRPSGNMHQHRPVVPPDIAAGRTQQAMPTVAQSMEPNQHAATQGFQYGRMEDGAAVVDANNSSQAENVGNDDVLQELGF